MFLEKLLEFLDVGAFVRIHLIPFVGKDMYSQCIIQINFEIF